VSSDIEEIIDNLRRLFFEAAKTRLSHTLACPCGMYLNLQITAEPLNAPRGWGD
jgi:hypothetical protein